MRDVLRRHWILLLVGAASLALFLGETLPAMRRDADLLREEARQRREWQRLLREAERLQAEYEGLLEGDPALLERALRDRYQGGGDPVVPR